MKIRQPIVVICGIALGVLLLAFILPNYRRSAASLAHPDPVGPTAYSKSAIGHAAFLEFLERDGIATATSQTGSGGFVAPNNLLVIAEPRADEGTLQEVKVMLTSRNVLLILPKRTGTADRNRPNWLAKDQLLADDAILPVLRLLDKQAGLTRNASLAGLSGAFRPAIDRPQLIRSDVIKPLIASPDGVLLGEIVKPTGRVVVLSDPDLIANHSLARGDNALLALNTVNLLRGREGVVIFDEFTHGFSDSPFHLLGILFQFPFVLVTVQIALAVLLLAWAAVARSGLPAPSPAPMEAGKRTLIDTGARLLAGGRHTGPLSAAYLAEIVRDTGRRLRAPRGLNHDAMLAWLAQMPGAPPAPTPHSPPQQIWTWRNTLLGRSRSHTQPDGRN